MKWNISKENPKGSGKFTPTGEVFEEPSTSWDDYGPSYLRARLDELQQDGDCYAASWIEPPPASSAKKGK